MELQEFLINLFGNESELDGNVQLLIQYLVIRVGLRDIFKPVTTLWQKYVRPNFIIKPTPKLEATPIYKVFAYILDHVASIKIKRKK